MFVLLPTGFQRYLTWILKQLLHVSRQCLFIQSLADRSFMLSLVKTVSVPFQFDTPQSCSDSVCFDDGTQMVLEDSAAVQLLFGAFNIQRDRNPNKSSVYFIDQKRFRSNSTCISSLHKGTSSLFLFISFNKVIQVRSAVWWVQELWTKQENSVLMCSVCKDASFTVHSMKSSN